MPIIPPPSPSSSTVGVASTAVLVGDVITTARGQIPDIAPTLPAPSAAFAIVGAGGSTLPAGTYYVVVTQRNRWGETMPSTESTLLTVAAGHGIEITSALLPGCSVIRAYLTMPGGAPGSEIQWVESATSPFIIQTPLTGFGTPPTRSTAYLPDSDGDTFGASTLYSWLNEGLKKLSRAVGGILDYAGVPTAAGQPLYVLPGEWLAITDVWYGGYWIQGGKRGDFFRRNTVTAGILGNVVISIFTDRQVMEVTYQPDRDAGTTQTSAVMTATDNAVAVDDPGAFLLPFGFGQIGSEIVAYSDPSMMGLIRGVGSTLAQAWPAGTPVTELSLFWCGRRIFNTIYVPGQSMTVLPIPVGWADILPIYVLAQAKKAEQDLQGWKQLEDTFYQQAEKFMLSNKGVVSLVQVGGSKPTLVYSPTPAGGLIIP